MCSKTWKNKCMKKEGYAAKSLLAGSHYFRILPFFFLTSMDIIWNYITFYGTQKNIETVIMSLIVQNQKGVLSDIS